MELASITERTFLIDPAGNRSEQEIEQRVDPLTGTVASVNLALGEKAKAFLGTADVEMLRDFETRSKTGCPFCSAEEKGTRFLPDLVKEGQLRIGKALAIQCSAEYCRVQGRNFWTELLDQERKAGARYIGSTDPVEWIATFAPAHQKEIWGVLPGVGSLIELDDRAAASFAEGLSRILSFYEKSGVHPFTFALFSSPDAGSGQFYSLHLRICAR